MRSSTRGAWSLRTVAAFVLVASLVTSGVVLGRNPTELSLAVLAMLAILLVGRLLFAGLLHQMGLRLQELERAVAFLNEREARMRLPIGRVNADGLEAISHEFNDLLTVILGFSNLALENIGAEDPEWEFLCEVRMAGERAKELTHQLVSVDRNACRISMADNSARAQSEFDSDSEILRVVPEDGGSADMS